MNHCSSITEGSVIVSGHGNQCHPCVVVQLLSDAFRV